MTPPDRIGLPGSSEARTKPLNGYMALISSANGDSRALSEAKGAFTDDLCGTGLCQTSREGALRRQYLAVLSERLPFWDLWPVRPMPCTRACEAHPMYGLAISCQPALKQSHRGALDASARASPSNYAKRQRSVRLAGVWPPTPVQRVTTCPAGRTTACSELCSHPPATQGYRGYELGVSARSCKKQSIRRRATAGCNPAPLFPSSLSPPALLSAVSAVLEHVMQLDELLAQLVARVEVDQRHARLV